MIVIDANRDLLSHAKSFKDVFKYFVGSNFLLASDLGEVFENKAEVFCKEVAAELGADALENERKVFVGLEEGLIVAGRGDDNVVFL